MIWRQGVSQHHGCQLHSLGAEREKLRLWFGKVHLQSSGGAVTGELMKTKLSKQDVKSMTILIFLSPMWILNITLVERAETWKRKAAQSSQKSLCDFLFFYLVGIDTNRTFHFSRLIITRPPSWPEPWGREMQSKLVGQMNILILLLVMVLKPQMKHFPGFSPCSPLTIIHSKPLEYKSNSLNTENLPHNHEGAPVILSTGWEIWGRITCSTSYL